MSFYEKFVDKLMSASEIEDLEGHLHNHLHKEFESIRRSILKSQLRTLIMCLFCLISATVTIGIFYPIPKEFYIHKIVFLVFIWFMFLTVSAVMFMFSPISVYASDRFICKKIFYTLAVVVAIPTFTSIYFGTALLSTAIRFERDDKALSDALKRTDYISRLPPEDLFPPENLAMVNVREVAFFDLFNSPGRKSGIVLIFIFVFGVWLDTILASWRIKKRFYGFNSMEAKELCEYVWKFESPHDGKGPWFRGPLWIRSYNKALFSVAEPEPKNG